MTIQILIGLLVVAVVVVFNFVLLPLVQKYKDDRKFQAAFRAAKMVVEALEQEIQGDGKGAERKAAALAQVKEILKTDFNIEVSEVLIDKAIEAAVFALNWAKKQGAKDQTQQA